MAVQTTVQESNTIRFGSAKFEVGEDVGSLVNLGAMDNVKFEETFDVVKIKTDNAGEISGGIRNHIAAIEGDLLEINLTNLNTIRGGIDTLTNVAGSSTDVTAEAITLTGTTQQRLANKNGDGTQVSSIAVKKGATTYTVNTDYSVAIDSAGYTVISRISGGGITSGDALTVDYTYTPNSAKKLTSGGKITLSDRVVRITNTNDAGDIFRITIYKAQTAQGITLELQPDESEDANSVTVRLEGRLDTSRTAGDQLFEIYDTQGV